MRRAAILLALVALPLPAAATDIIVSAKPDAVNVSIVRDPNRGAGGDLNLSNLNGFALISETRTVDLPAGPAKIRFEGVAEGMVAVSAIVTGLPGGTVQKNRDAALLSPASLLDGTLGNRVTLRRTDKATGKVTEQDATIRSRADGAVVLQTAEGYQAVRCTGPNETLIYNGVPQGLSATPVLSVDTVSPAATRATVTLTYLATGFDWAANYVARVAEDGRTADLMAWLTVANSNGQSFADANLMVLAGTLNVESDYDSLVEAPPQPQLYLRCFPLGSGRDGIERLYSIPPPPAAPPPPPVMMASDAIVVTAQRRMAPVMESVAAITAVQEELGDLKLYRVPERMTVAANGQKQVAMIVKDDVPFERRYRLNINPRNEGLFETSLMLRMQNKEARKLGVPLPSGRIAVFEPVGDQMLLVGRGDVRDYAVGETVKLFVGDSSQVSLSIARGAPARGELQNYVATLINANPYTVTAEIGFAIYDDDAVSAAVGKLPRMDGYPTWTVTVPANSVRTLSYRAKG